MNKLAKLYKVAKETGAALDKAVKKTKSKNAVDPAVSKEFEANIVAKIKKMNADVAKDFDKSKKLTKAETKLILNPTLAGKRAKIKEKNRTVSSDPRKPKGAANARNKPEGAGPFTKVKGKGRKPTRGELDSRMTKEILGTGAVTVALPAIGIGVADSKRKAAEKKKRRALKAKTKDNTVVGPSNLSDRMRAEYKAAKKNAKAPSLLISKRDPKKKNMGGMMRSKMASKGGAMKKKGYKAGGVVKAAKKIQSMLGANFDDAKTKTGATSKGRIRSKDGKTTTHLMGPAVIKVQNRREQLKGGGKAAAAAAALYGIDKLPKGTKEELNAKSGSGSKSSTRAAFEKAFSKARNDGKSVFTFRGKKYNTDISTKTAGKVSRVVKKNMGGMMKKKGYSSGGAVRKATKPRGVGAATRGYGKAMR